MEINASFYQFPTEASLTRWYNLSPENFRFSLKVPRAITHFKKFHDCTNFLTDFYSIASAGLREKIGCVLFQLPGRMVYSDDTLSRILGSLNPSFTNVIEFRHSSWWNETVYQALEQANAVFCGVSFPGLPDDVIRTANQIYYRFHGVPQLYKSLYSDDFIIRKQSEIVNAGGVENWVYFNNTWGTAAIANAQKMRSLFS